MRTISRTTTLAILVLLGTLMAAMPAMAATEAEIEEAIVDGLAYLAGHQFPDGSWEQHVGITGMACLKFEDRARELGFDDPTDPGYQYYQVVIGCLEYIVGEASDVDISSEPQADGDNDGIGTVFIGDGHATYNTGIAMMALAASQRPDLYAGLLQDALDWMCFAQNNPACGIERGGWGYAANQCYGDNSNGGYATLGLGYAAAVPPFGFGLTVPQFVMDELSLWIDALQDSSGGPDDGGSHYCVGCGWVNILKTGNLLYEMRFVGDGTSTGRVQRAIDYIERHWGDSGGCNPGWTDHRQAMFTMMKGFEALDIKLIDLDNDGTPEHDWFDEVSTHLVATQNADGSWPNDCWGGQILSTAWGLLALERVVPPPPPHGRVDISHKGSLLVYPKIELKWNSAGLPVQDTFVTILNDYPDDVFVHWYFVNGDEPLEAVVAGDPPELIERAHPGWNWVNCSTVLTQNEPTYFSALTGSGGCQPFTTLDTAGGVVGRLDPEAADGSRVLRGFAIAYAVDRHGNEISWNHLSGSATVVSYADQAAWEYNAYAFQASAELGLWTNDAPGEFLLDGGEYEVCFDKLLLDFYAVGSPAFSQGATAVMLDTDLTLFPVMADLRQDNDGPLTTKAKFDIWNQNEDGFSGTTRCITCWDQTLLSNYELPNHFMMSTIHTDKGKARIDGIFSTVCPESVDAPLLGVAAKLLGFSGAASGRAFSGMNLVGQGEEAGYFLADIIEPPSTLTDPVIKPVTQTPERGKR